MLAPPQRARRYPPPSRENSTPIDSSQAIASGASDVSTETSSGSAVPCEDSSTSRACRSGESSACMAAWMPPWAIPVLQEAREPLVTSTTWAPASAAAHAAARPAPPLPITSTSACTGRSLTERIVPKPF